MIVYYKVMIVFRKTGSRCECDQSDEHFSRLTFRGSKNWFNEPDWSPHRLEFHFILTDTNVYSLYHFIRIFEKSSSLWLRALVQVLEPSTYWYILSPKICSARTSALNWSLEGLVCTSCPWDVTQKILPTVAATACSHYHREQNSKAAFTSCAYGCGKKILVVEAKRRQLSNSSLPDRWINTGIVFGRIHLSRKSKIRAKRRMR